MTHEVFHPLIPLFLLLASGLLAQGAEISWNAAQDTAAASDIRTDGSLVMAQNEGGSAVAVNGVPFEAANSLGMAFSGALEGAITGDTGLDGLLNTLSYGGGTSTSIDLGTFTPGSVYLVQVFFTDQRSSFNDRIMRFSSSTGTGTVDVEADPDNTTASPWGQFASGTFTADGTDPDLILAPQGFGNAHITAWQVRLVTAGSVPVATLSTASSEVSGPFTVDIAFSEDVTGLELSDVQVTNGSVTPASLSSSNSSSYSLEITPAANGEVTVQLPAGSVTDLDGENNTNPDSNLLSVFTLFPGSDSPQATLSVANPTVFGPFTVDVNFTEPITGLTAEDFAVSNGAASSLSGSGASFAVQITPGAEGDVTIDLPAASVTDVDGDLLENRTAATLTVTYSIPDNPVATLYGNTQSSTPSFDVYLTFSEAVTGLTDSDFEIVNGTASGTVSLSGSTLDTHLTPLQSRYFKTTITAAKPGQVSVRLPAGSVTDTDGDAQTNLASHTLTTLCTADFGDAWVIDSATEWTAAHAGSSNLNLADGLAAPTADSATFTSTVQTYARIRRPLSVTFRQSPVWDNWQGVSTVAPSGASDAPILLPVANDDYYFLAKGPTSAYYAWHSTDMLNWTGPSRVTNEGGDNGRWTTSAEYKDGTFYILYDSPNDEDPALYLDNDLMDGVVGTQVGMVFDDPSHGSDSSIIRNDEDGRFHIIYEDWSPIKARANSWDSPLAGHTSSPDGINGFAAHAHHPAVDHRTTPTGTFDTYSHPNGTYEYEIHTPAQDAYGDWTSIKIGSQFYLFGDYDLHGSGIKVARFTSDSIHDKFELVGSLGGGHPDPTVGFAEGQFYLITQQSTDYTSPGPWVAGVEARAGVDTDGDTTIDQWTTWQEVSEAYDHKPGYARVVDVTPARLDLSGLPAGYGFQFELRLDDTVVGGISPLVDRVEFAFEPGNFQQWANANNVAADPNADANGNGLPNLVEFASGWTEMPEIRPGASFDLTTTQEALEEEYQLEIWFSKNLESWWRASLGLPTEITLSGDTFDADGNRVRSFSLHPDLSKLFYYVEVMEP